MSDVEAGDAAAGDLVGVKGCAVFVGDVAEAVDFGGLLEPANKGFEFDFGGFLLVAEADVDDDEGHIGDSEVAFGAFPKAELDASGGVEIVDTCSDGIPVEGYFVRVTAEYVGDIILHIKKYVHDSVAG